MATIFDPGSQAEKLALLRQDRPGSTMFQQARADVEMAQGGRFGAVSKTTVTGSVPSQQVPRQPATAWVNDRLPDEPPLGYEINAVEPVGTYQEIQQSIQQTQAPAFPNPQGAEPPVERDVLASVAAPGGPSSTTRLRRI
jgi:hypothetical protein